jgi:hypothetical protein
VGYLKRIYTDRDFDMCCTGFNNIYDPVDR